jgi:hypothetical protein
MVNTLQKFTKFVGLLAGGELQPHQPTTQQHTNLNITDKTPIPLVF